MRTYVQGDARVRTYVHADFHTWLRFPGQNERKGLKIATVLLSLHPRSLLTIESRFLSAVQKVTIEESIRSFGIAQS